jgi:hypothetical protein
MMGKRLRNLALLGGLGAAAYMMGSKKGDSKKDVDTTADASAGRARDRLGGAGFDRGDKDTTGDMSAGQAKDRLKDLNVAPVKKAKKTDTKPAAVTKAPTRTVTKKEEGETASGLPREARGGGSDADKYREKMARLEKEQALKTVNPEQYLGPGRLLGGLNTMAKGLAARMAKKGSDTAKTSTSRDIVPAGAGPTARFLGRGPRQEMPPQLGNVVGAKKGGMIKSSASKRGDGIAMKGKTRGRMV